MNISPAGWVIPVAGVTSAAIVATGIYIAASSDTPQGAPLLVQPAGTKEKDKDKVGNKTFQISGSIAGLYPDVVGKQLSLQLTNAANQRVTVISLTVTAADASNGCSGANLLFGPVGDRSARSKTFSPNVAIDGRGTEPFSVDVTMASDAANSCSSSHFPLTYTGTAVQS